MTTTDISFSVPSSIDSWTTKTALKFQQELKQTLIKVQVTAEGNLYKQGKELPALQSGDLDMATLSVSDLGSPFSVLSRPFLLKSYGQVKQLYASEFGEEFQNLVYETLGIKLVGMFYIGTRQIGTTGKVIHTPEDLKGFDFRMPIGDAWTHLGKALGAEDPYLKCMKIHDLSKSFGDTVQGTDNPLTAFRSYNLDVKRINLTAHLVDYLFIGISGKKWDRLSEGYRKLVLDAVNVAENFNDTHRIEEENALLTQYAAEGVVSLPDIKAFQEHSDNYYKKLPLTEQEKSWMERIRSQFT